MCAALGLFLPLPLAGEGGGEGANARAAPHHPLTPTLSPKGARELKPRQTSVLRYEKGV